MLMSNVFGLLPQPNEQNDNTMDTTQSKKELASYGNDADVIMTIAGSETKVLIAEKADRT